MVYSTPNQFGTQQKSQVVQQSGNNITMQQLSHDFDNIKKAVNTMESHINMFRQAQNTQYVQYNQHQRNIQRQYNYYKQNITQQYPIQNVQQPNYNVLNTQQQQYVQQNMRLNNPSNIQYGQVTATAQQYHYK